MPLSRMVAATLRCHPSESPAPPTHGLCYCLLGTALAWSESPASVHARTASVGLASKKPDGLTGFICPGFTPLAGDEEVSL